MFQPRTSTPGPTFERPRRAGEAAGDEPPATVSVVIPTFNCAAYLAEAVRSVLAQTHSAREIIVVDDGSTDDTAAVAASFGDAIVYLRQENAGVAAARNRGLARSTGAYVAFLDADDYWAPEKLEIQLRVMAASPDVDLVCSDFWLDGDRTRASYIRTKYKIFSTYRLDWPAMFPTRRTVPGTRVDAWAGAVFATLFLGNFINTSSVLLRRRAWQRAGSFAAALRTQEDYDYWLKVARHGALAFIDAPLLAFRRRGDQLTAAHQRLRLARDVLTVVEAATPHASTIMPPALVAKRLSERCAAVAIALLAAGQPAQARNLLQLALAHRPLSPAVGGLMVWSFLPLPVGSAIRRVTAAAKAAAHQASPAA